MAHLILPKANLNALIRKRRQTGHDRYDEVWNGVYVMSPIADNNHQWIASKLTIILYQALGAIAEKHIFTGTNISDQPVDWTKNYRVPDVAIFLPGNPAEDRNTHWFGGPDFAVEVISKGDQSRKKFDFYAKVGVRELLLIDRYPWRLELFRNDGVEMKRAGSIAPGDSDRIVSKVLPVSFRLIESREKLAIEVNQTVDGRVWRT